MFPLFPIVPPRFLPIAVAIAASAFSLSAQPRLVKDINVTTSPVGSDPQPLRTIGDVTFFSAQTAATGNELWKTDGTASGTALVRDLFPGPASGLATDFVSTATVGNRLIFVANDGVHGWECWASDGTATGTVQLADIGLTQSMDAIFGPAIGQTLYFTARTDGSTSRELWRTDGTPAGTQRVLDRNSAVGQSGLSMIAPLGSLLLLSSGDGTDGAIHTTDGTAAGTHFIAPYGTSSGVSLGDAVLFVHNPAPTEWKLMRTDGTNPGTTLLRDGFTRIAPFRVMNGVAYFIATDPVHGNGLWRSDGTIAGTSLVADLTPGANPAAEPLQASLRAVLRDRLLFFITPGKLWISDGTAAGTHLVKEIPALGFVVSGGHFYFSSPDATHGWELWKTDGTAEGTMLVADIAPGPSDSMEMPFRIVARPGGVLFAANDGVAGNEPWITDGTTAGTRLLGNIAPEKHVGSDPSHLANVDGRLFFRASGGVWMSDGTTEGTARLETAGDLPDEQPAVGSGGLYYFVKGSYPAFELWRTDGTAPGTFHLYTMGDSRSRFDDMTPFNGGLLFQGSDPATGMEPWFTTGTVAGTRLLEDIDPGMYSGYFVTDGTTVVEERTALLEAHGVDGHGELWRTDGTPAGTRRLAILSPHEWAKTSGAYTKFGEAFYFVGARRDGLLTLWRVDAVSGAVTAIRPIGNWLSTTSIWNLGGTMLFTAGNQLWRSDGTEAGTTRIHDAISPPPCDPRIGIVVGDGVLYWYAFAEDVPELWRSDGTAAGTFRLGSFPGPFTESLQDCRQLHLHYSDERLYFIGRDDLYGAEPWVTNGTLMGTRMLWDVNPGPESSNPASFLRIGRTLFFSADEPSAGRELWAMETGCDGKCPPRRRRVRH